MDILKPKQSQQAQSDGLLVWIDCEMTGLDPEKEEILEIHCLITTGDLELLDEEGWGTVIHHPKSRLDQMDEWCTRTHGTTGLTDAVLASTTTPQQAAEGLLAYIKRHVPEQRTALLAGNSVHADRAFLAKPPYAAVLEYLHYRLLDVSTIKEAVRRWCPPVVLLVAPWKKGVHRGREDILESIAEARYYRDAVFGLTWKGKDVEGEETPASEKDAEEAWADNLL
ncbi:exonuclease [Sodiomyces alkalinus F11]|uniref:Exonuclease n=1 Tax=Sodiomyces alkalinus (strain CBS 110278 / VKM F-3762 / F11) TaxID=1314773 RepID=A0A3N2PJS3_SODAK|nr:exonuclease [Sodiomyces alkalinus F11]ROT34777.1 exonuclease [Sodiomyces alkalinus F11]